MGRGEGEGKLPHSHPHLTPAPIPYRPSIPDGGIANPIYYLAFRSKMTPVLQAMRVTNFNTCHLLLYNFQLNTPKGSVKAPAVELLRLNTLWSRYQNCFLITSKMYHEQLRPSLRLGSNTALIHRRDKAEIDRGYYTLVRRYECERVRYCSCHENIKFISSS